MKINKKWHEEYKMPKNPTLEERIKWHIEHTKQCSCRPIPESLRLKIKELTKKKV
jgi:hypothetical protein